MTKSGEIDMPTSPRRSLTTHTSLANVEMRLLGKITVAVAASTFGAGARTPNSLAEGAAGDGALAAAIAAFLANADTVKVLTS